MFWFDDLFLIGGKFLYDGRIINLPTHPPYLFIVRNDNKADIINQNSITNAHQTIPVSPNWFADHTPMMMVTIVGIKINRIIINIKNITPPVFNQSFFILSPFSYFW